MRRLLLLVPAVALAMAGCIGGPSPTGISADQLAEQINGARSFVPDECYFWVSASSSGENWVNGKRGNQFSGSQADGLVRGRVIGLERAYIAGAVLAVRIQVTFVHGSTSTQIGSTVLVPVSLGMSGSTEGEEADWQERGAPLLALRFSDQTEAVAAVRNPDSGGYLTPNDHCEPMVIGDAGSSAMITNGGSWFEQDLDAVEEDAAEGLVG